ncbi:glycosyl transferase [Cellulophaga geojensis KL-A]|uniref:Glycosyl transferase n=1 Tax=Cellulophaga geojensis KL-A TaxID=1328323 RepID=A0ABP3B9Q5_9FLAO|nr:glycosyltransferase family 4 protein [Cellulophaga geojensis]EWH14544.1 glycosyl transferase [Cellulophaga geojensis KL-A]
MRIGIVTTWFERGAAYVSKQYKEVLEKENDVFIYARGGEEFAIKDPLWNKGNITWGKQFKNSTRTKIDLKDFRNWVLSNELEIVIFNEQHEWSPVIECDKMGVIIGAYIDYYKKETVPFFHLYDFLFCNTQRHYSVFKNHFQAKYFPWGTNTDLFIPNEFIEIADKDCIQFFHSAGMNPFRKGTDFVLRAAHSIITENFKLIIHSQVSLYQFFPENNLIINELIKAEKLQVIDETISAPGLYKFYDVYLYPSRLEGIGLTVPEAISCGLPTVTTDQPPMNEFVKKDISGRLVKVDSVEKRSDNYFWSQSIISVDSLKKEMLYYIVNREKIGLFKKKARNYALENLDWVKNTSEINDYILSLKKNKDINKSEIIKNIKDYERNRPFIYYLNTYKPYLKFKKIIKHYFKYNKK